MQVYKKLERKVAKSIVICGHSFRYDQGYWNMSFDIIWDDDKTLEKICAWGLRHFSPYAHWGQKNCLQKNISHPVHFRHLTKLVNKTFFRENSPPWIFSFFRENHMIDMSTFIVIFSPLCINLTPLSWVSLMMLLIYLVANYFIYTYRAGSCKTE